MKINLMMVISAALTLNGCMMMAMGSMSHDLHSDHGKQQSRTVETQNNDFKAVLTVPELKMGKESEIVVNVYDSHGMAISGAKITLQFGAVQDMKDHQNHSSSGVDELVVAETLKKGTYSLKRRFDDHGEIRITAKIAYPENSDPLLMSTTSEVAHKAESHGGRSMTPMIIIGAAMMVGMMAFMIGRNYN